MTPEPRGGRPVGLRGQRGGENRAPRHLPWVDGVGPRCSVRCQRRCPGRVRLCPPVPAPVVWTAPGRRPDRPVRALFTRPLDRRDCSTRRGCVRAFGRHSRRLSTGSAQTTDRSRTEVQQGATQPENSPRREAPIARPDLGPLPGASPTTTNLGGDLPEGFRPARSGPIALTDHLSGRHCILFTIEWAVHREAAGALTDANRQRHLAAHCWRSTRQERACASASMSGRPAPAAASRS